MSRPILLNACTAASALGLLLCAFPARAACYVTKGYVEKIVNMNIGRVVIPNDATVGTVFKQQLFPLPLSGSTNKPWTCTKGGVVKGVMLQGTPVPGYDYVFTTSVPGVGIRLSRYFNQAEVSYYPHERTTNDDFSSFNAASRFQVELFKTAPVTGNGPLAQGTYTRYYSVADTQSVLTTNLLGEGITIITPSCSVDLGSRNILVQFGKVPKDGFKGRGSTTAERKFSIKLNCKAGQNAQNTVYLRMDAPQDPSNEQGVLQPTRGAPNLATGVGIQVIDEKNMPVKFGEETLVGTSRNGDYVLNYTARYFQTGNQVTPGRADGTATFSIDYK
ncbi:MAG: fimbrial protein [Pseudomonadota bacterium]